MARMPGRAPKIEIPRWIQLVGLPLLLVFLWLLAGAARHVVFLFLVAALIALILDPVVRLAGRARIPRGFAVAMVYVTFIVVLIVVIGAFGTVVVNETKTAAKRSRSAGPARLPPIATSTVCSSGSTPITSRASRSRTAATTSSARSGTRTRASTRRRW